MKARRLVRSALPTELHEHCTGIVRRLQHHGRGCAHLADNPVAYVCVQHPTIARCQACTDQHITTHTEREEHNCDMCGEHLAATGDDTLSLLLAHPVEIDTTMSIGRGRRAAVGIVWLLGWGACPVCWPSLTPGVCA